MPEGMEIDHKSNLNGVISGYAEQVLVCTGRDDWTSRIEDESDGDNLAADLKELFGRGGRYSDVRYSLTRLKRRRRKLTRTALPQRVRPQFVIPIIYTTSF